MNDVMEGGSACRVPGGAHGASGRRPGGCGTAARARLHDERPRGARRAPGENPGFSHRQHRAAAAGPPLAGIFVVEAELEETRAVLRGVASVGPAADREGGSPRPCWKCTCSTGPAISMAGT
jgi:hypothetical protein